MCQACSWSRGVAAIRFQNCFYRPKKAFLDVLSDSQPAATLKITPPGKPVKVFYFWGGKDGNKWY